MKIKQGGIKISNKWVQAINKGWNITTHKNNGNLIAPKNQLIPQLTPWVENDLPKLFDNFYKQLINQMEEYVDVETAIELVEEIAAIPLAEMMVGFAGQVKPDLLEQE